MPRWIIGTLYLCCITYHPRKLLTLSKLLEETALRRIASFLLPSASCRVCNKRTQHLVPSPCILRIDMSFVNTCAGRHAARTITWWFWLLTFYSTLHNKRNDLKGYGFWNSSRELFGHTNMVFDAYFLRLFETTN